MYCFDDIKNSILTKEEIYKKLNGKNVTSVFIQNEGISIFALRDSEGVTYLIDLIREGS